MVNTFRYLMRQFMWHHPAYYLILPEIAISIVGTFIFIFATLLPNDFHERTPRNRWEKFKLRMCWFLYHSVPTLSIGVQLFSILMTIQMIYNTSRFFTYNLGQYWGGLETVDPFSLFFEMMVDITTIFAIWTAMADRTVKRFKAEYFAILNFASITLMFMVASSDLLTIWFMTEFNSIVFYILTVYSTDRKLSLEAGLKYFVYGMLAGIVMLFGISFAYGLSGSTNLYDLKYALLVLDFPKSVIILSALLIMFGLAYKIALVPMHFWAPDVFEGAPLPTTAYLSVAPKVAGVAVFIRIFLIGYSAVPELWMDVLTVFAVLSVLVGVWGMLKQRKLTRFMGYSGIAQMGFIMFGVVSAGSLGHNEAIQSYGFGSAIFYVFSFIFTNYALFIVLMVLHTSLGLTDEIENLKGILKRAPVLGFALVLSLISLAGVPISSGFVAKLLILLSVFSSKISYVGFLVLFLYIISVVPYLKLLWEIVFVDYRKFSHTKIKSFIVHRFPLAIAVFMIVVMGVFPEWFFQFSLNSYIVTFYSFTPK